MYLVKITEPSGDELANYAETCPEALRRMQREKQQEKEHKKKKKEQEK